MKIELTVEFDGEWVLEHRGDDVLPVARVGVLFRREFGADVSDDNLTRAVVTIDKDVEPEMLVDTAEALLMKEFGDAGGDFFSLTHKIVTDKDEPKKQSEHDEENKDVAAPEEEVAAVETKEKKEEKRIEEDRAGKNPDGALESILAAGRSPKRETFEGDTDEILKEVDALTGAAEFKALAHEIALVAPALKESGTVGVFTSRAYLFAVGDGYGLTTYLEYLAKIIGVSGLRKFSNAAVTELKLGPVKEGGEPFEEVNRVLGSGSAAHSKVLCVDISEWINAADSRSFKAFLKNVTAHTDEFVVVFRTPFVDRYVFDRLKRALNDILFIRSVSVSSFTEAELTACAERYLGKYGYSMTPAAIKAFGQRLAEERADGRFYGLNTVSKVANELLYEKQLYNARRGIGDKRIDGKAAAGILGGATAETGAESLRSLVGMESVEKRIGEIVAQIEYAVKNGGDRPCIHMRFVGNPGTGKTTAARIVGRILKEKGILSVGHLYEYSGRDFCGKYIGETAPKTAGMCRDAYGSVLFIDEAYSLYRGGVDSKDYGREALDTLIAEMENHRSDFVVIMAGYPKEMETLMEGNAGLASRMPYLIEFPNFDRPALFEIFKRLAQKTKYNESLLTAAEKYFDGMPDDMINADDFSNARFVRNLFERTVAKASMRSSLAGRARIVLNEDDFARAVADGEFKYETKKQNKIGFVTRN